MADKSGETKQKDEGKPLTDKDLANVSGGIIIKSPDPNQGGIIIYTPPADPSLPRSR